MSGVRVATASAIEHGTEIVARTIGAAGGGGNCTDIPVVCARGVGEGGGAREHKSHIGGAAGVPI